MPDGPAEAPASDLAVPDGAVTYTSEAEPQRKATTVQPDAPCDMRTAAKDETAPDKSVEANAPELSEEEMEDEARELGLPSPRTLGPGSDFKAFMASDVPDHLRRFALRRLWRSNPILANVDGLVDYGEDFTDAGTVIEGMKTAYQVGTG